MDFLDLINPNLKGASSYNVYRKGELMFSVKAVKSNNKITVYSSQYHFKKDDLLIEKNTECQYIVKDIQIIPKPPISSDIILSVYIPTNSTPAPSITIGNVQGGNVVIGSNQVEINNQISQLPPEEQALANELLNTLNECIRTKTLPKKTFSDRFGEFISKYGSLVPAFGSLALQILTFVRG